eukprot:gene22096-30331_t
MNSSSTSLSNDSPLLKVGHHDDDADALENAVIDWLHTFNLGSLQCASYTDLFDGSVFALVLNQIAPGFFDDEVLQMTRDASASNRTIRVNNFRKILRLLDGYYKTILGKKIDMTAVDVNRIVNGEDTDDLVNLLELLIGAAVMCEEKATFIRNIFLLNHSAQAMLKRLVERVLGRVEDIQQLSPDSAYHGGRGLDSQNDLEDGPDTLGGSMKSSTNMNCIKMSDEDRNRSNELLQHLQMERQRLLAESAALAQSNETLRAQLHRLQDSSQQQKVLESSESMRATVAEERASRLQLEVDELRRESDLKAVEFERLRSELSLSKSRLEQAKEHLLLREMAARQTADELDIAREKTLQLARTEQSLEKYQRRLEEMVDLKRQNKELNDRLDKALDDINQLETTNKTLQGVNKLVEQHRNRAVQLDSEAMQMKSALLSKDSQLSALQKELDQTVLTRDRLEQELKALRIQLISHDEILSPSETTTTTEDKGHEDTVAGLKEKLRRLQRKEREMGISSDVPKEDTDNESEMLQLLRRDLQDEQNIRSQREEQLLQVQKQIQDQQQDSKDAERRINAQMKDLSNKLSESGQSIQMLEQRLREKEALADKLEQEKEKLENYAKRSLTTFKDKYMSVLHSFKEEKRVLEARLQKLEATQDSWHREERMLSSAIYEVGVRIMDRRIKQGEKAPADSGLGLLSHSNETFAGGKHSINPSSSRDAAVTRLFPPDSSAPNLG